MIKKVGNIYWLDTRIDGRRVRRTLNTDSKYIALRQSQKIIDELKKELSKKDIKFDKFVDQYMEWAWQHKPASMRQEVSRLVIIQEFFRSLKIEYLSEITPLHIEQLRTHLRIRRLKTRDSYNEHQRSSATINRYVQILRYMFYRAIDWELYHKQNPVKKVRLYKEPKTIKPLSRDDVVRVVAAAREIQRKPRSALQRIFADLVIFAIHTGLRRSEVLNLRWSDVKDGKAEVLGKGSKRRTVPINKVALDIIARQPRRTEYVFHVPNRDQATVLWNTTERVKKITGIDFHFHLLRHFFASQLLEKGIDIVTISTLLGHSRLTTSLIYSHTNEERRQMAVDSLDSF